MRSETKRKLIQAQDNLQQLAEEIADETGGPFFLADSDPLDKDTRKKAENFDGMVSAIKQKITESDKRTVIQLLTLAPQCQ